MKKILLAAILTGLVPVGLFAESGGGVEFSRSAEASNYTHVTDVGDYERFSFQVVYASVTPSAATISDGEFSVVNFTVADYAGLNGSQATVTITLTDGKNTTAIDDSVVTVNGRAFTEGVEWDRLTTSTMTMADLASAIDDHWEFSTAVSSNVITVTSLGYGTAPNSWAITSSTGVLELSGAVFSGGQEYGYLTINYVTLTEGTDWDAETSSDTTAGNIAAAINADSTLSEIVTATNTTTTGVVTVTSLLSGVNAYPVDVCDWTDLTPDYSAFVSGVASDIDVAADSITEEDHGFSVGLPVLYAEVSGTSPTGLTDATTYYAIPLTENTFQLADVSTNAVAGTEIDITAVTGSGSFTITPIAFSAGSAGFKWQGSNDGTNFVDIDITSVTYSADGNDLWNYADYAYKYIRFNYTGTTYGGIDLDGTIHWRKN